jgi:ankyrin repeat protein
VPVFARQSRRSLLEDNRQ